MLTGKLNKEEVSGPVGVVTAINESTEQAESTGDAIFNLVYMTALITINLGIFNLLPIPGLDGLYVYMSAVEDKIPDFYRFYISHIITPFVYP